MKPSLSTKILGISLTSLILTAGVNLPAHATPSVPNESMQVAQVADPAATQKAELLKRINDYRATKGLKALTLNSSLGTVAQAWTAKTADEGGFKHNLNFSAEIPVNWVYAAEIIGAAETPEEIFLGWKNSYEHNEVLISPKATEIGFGYAYQAKATGEYPGMYYASAIAADYSGKLDNISVAATAPTFDLRTYTIPNAIGVQYQVNGVNVEKGTYTGNGNVNVTAVAKTGFTLLGTAAWSKYYEGIVVIDPSPSVKIVIPKNVTFTDTHYFIPETVGVEYKVNGAVKRTGTFLGTGTVTVTASALTGYTLGGTSSWTNTFLIPVTPNAPAFLDTHFFVPVTEGVQYKVNGVVKPAGKYTTPGTYTVTASATAGYRLQGTSTWTGTVLKAPQPQPQPDPIPTPTPGENPSIKSASDVVTIDPSGNLWNYTNLQSGRTQIGHGWQGFSDIHLVDWNQDGYTDIIGKDNAGNLYFYKSIPAGGFQKIQIGHGWQGYSIDIAKWDNRSAYPSIIAMNAANGNLYNYKNGAGSGITSVAHIGSGWNGFDINILDWDKDGALDVVAKNPAGQLMLYRSNGTGSFKGENREAIGSGWNIFNSISVVKNMGGNGTSGLLARNTATGALMYYQANTKTWSSTRQVGSGWNGYKLSNQMI